MRPVRAWHVSLVGFLLLLLAVGVQKVWSIDFWWQIRNGEWIIEHGKVPTSEMYSWSAAGNPLREMRWLYCSAVYLLFARVGEWAPSLLQAALVSAAWLALAWPFRRDLRHPMVIALLALGLLAGLARWVMRPELATYVGFAVFLTLLTRLREGGRWRSVLGLVGMQVVWVNTHTLFLFGPVLAWCFVAGDAVQRGVDRWRGGTSPGAWIHARLAMAAAGVTAACWINPYFHDGAMYAVQMYRETRAGHATNQIIGEMRSPLAIPLADWTWDLFACVALAGAAVVTVARSWRRLDVVTGGILLLGVILFAQLQRNTPLLALCAVWAALRTIHAEPRGAGEVGARRAWAAHGAVASGCVLAAWSIMADRVGARLNQPRESGLGVVRGIVPEGGAGFLREHPPTGRLFNVVRDGAYLIWAAREAPVFIDGRTDAYGPALLTVAASMSPTNWDAWSAEQGVTAAMLPTLGYSALVAHLAGSPEWALVFVDHRSVVFFRRTAAPAWVMERESGRVEAAIGAAGRVTEEPIEGWKRLIGARARAWKAEGWAQVLVDLGRPAEARAAMEAGLAVEPGNERLRVLLAPVVFVEGRASEASRLLDGLSAELRFAAFREAARRAMAEGKAREAEAALLLSLELAPRDATSRDLRVALGDIRYQTGRLAEAAADYEVAQAVAPTVNEWNKLATIYLGQRDAGRAERALRASLAMDGDTPGQAGVWVMLGGLLAQRGDVGNARACYERALAIHPNHAGAREGLRRLPG